jgi:hypothetical protein
MGRRFGLFGHVAETDYFPATTGRGRISPFADMRNVLSFYQITALY